MGAAEGTPNSLGTINFCFEKKDWLQSAKNGKELHWEALEVCVGEEECFEGRGQLSSGEGLDPKVYFVESSSRFENH